MLVSAMALFCIFLESGVLIQSSLTRSKQQPSMRELLPIAVERSVIPGAIDREGAFDSYRLRPYLGYSKDSSPWEVLIGMSAANDDRLTRGALGRVDEVLELRRFGGDSVAARMEFSLQSNRVRKLLGDPLACIRYRKPESVEVRLEWEVEGRYFAVAQSRGHDDERVALLWGGGAPTALPRAEERCSKD